MTTAAEEEAQGKANAVLTTSTAVLSLLGTLFVIISYFVWKDIQTKSRRILLYISVADFFTAVGTILGLWSSTNKTVCAVQSAIGTLAVLCSFFWTVFMAVYLYVAISRKNTRAAQNLMMVFHILGWGVPALIVAVAVSTHKLGNNGDLVSSGWCWVSLDMSWAQQVGWMLLAGKAWEIAASIVITVLYFLMKRNIKRELSREDRLLTESTVVAAQRAERKLMLVPLLFVVFRIWGTIRFFIFLAEGADHQPPDYLWLVLLQGVGDNAQGFTNFLVFCFFTEKVLGRIKAYCRAFVSCSHHSGDVTKGRYRPEAIYRNDEASLPANEDGLESTDTNKACLKSKTTAIGSYGSV